MINKFVDINSNRNENLFEDNSNINTLVNIQTHKEEKNEVNKEKLIGKKRQIKNESNNQNQNSAGKVKTDYDNINLLDFDAKINRSENYENYRNLTLSNEKNIKENIENNKNTSSSKKEYNESNNFNDDSNTNKNIINFINDKSVSDELSSDDSSNLI